MPKPLPWDAIADPAARELLVSAQRQARLRRIERPATGFPGSLPKPLAPYQAWLRETLPGSGLAQQMLAWAQALPGKPDTVPDIYPALPWWIRWFERLRHPRSPKAIAAHVAYYLEWYAAPLQPLRPDLGILRKIGPVGCYYCLHWPVVILIIVALGLLHVLLTIAGIIGSIVLLLAALFNVTDMIFLPLILGSGSPRQRINRVELFYYLKDQLS